MITNNYITLIISPLIALILVLVLTPFFRKIAFKLNFVDKPNYRKSHFTAIPLIGGFMVFLCATIALTISKYFNPSFQQISPLIIGSFILLVMGIIDDKVNLRASLKLIIQLGVAVFVYSSGIKIESLFGILGINEIPEIFKFILTVLIITGTVNAFNLSDGIDGLAGGLAIIGFTSFSIIALVHQQYLFASLFLTIIGALIGFLKYNLSKKRKIFMGDAGSLFLGYILVVSGIMLIQESTNTPDITRTLSTVIGVLILPVIDSIRVYRKRIQKGFSPFRADKTHLHHLLLGLKLEHKKATLVIVITAITLLMLSIFAGEYFSNTATIIILLFLFSVISRFLSMNNEINEWRKKIYELENDNRS